MFVLLALVVSLSGPHAVIRSRPLSNIDLIASESHRIAPGGIFLTSDFQASSSMVWSADAWAVPGQDAATARLTTAIDAADRVPQSLSNADVISPLDLQASGSANSEPPEPGTLIVPMLIILFVGGVWRYYRSPAYVELYDRLFGPLDEY